MRRREFVAGIATSTVWPLTAQAQRPSLPVIGFLNGSSPATWAPFAGAFRRGLKEAGYIEDQNVAVEYRWAEAQAASLPKLARELADRQPAVIVAAGGDQAILTARNANTTTPLLFITGSDPVKLGLVASLNRPGSNLTGVTHFTSALETKTVRTTAGSCSHRCGHRTAGQSGLSLLSNSDRGGPVGGTRGRADDRCGQREHRGDDRGGGGGKC